MTGSNHSYIAAFGQYYIFRGMVHTGARRFSDVLNDRMYHAFRLADVRGYSLEQLSEPAFTAPEFYLRKQRFDIFTILREEREVNAKRLYAFVPKEPRKIVCFLNGFKIEGILHLRQKHTQTGTLSMEGSGFLPITDATLSHIEHEQLLISNITVLLREAALDAISISEEELMLRAS